MRRLGDNDPLTAIEWLLAETGLRPSTLGRKIANDPRLVTDLRDGREPRPATIAAITNMRDAVRQQREACHA
jgi:hypothetical protein